MWEPGLPAMQAPRCISDTEVTLSQASQLPHTPVHLNKLHSINPVKAWRAQVDNPL